MYIYIYIIIRIYIVTISTTSSIVHIVPMGRCPLATSGLQGDRAAEICVQRQPPEALEKWENCA